MLATITDSLIVAAAPTIAVLASAFIGNALAERRAKKLKLEAEERARYAARVANGVAEEMAKQAARREDAAKQRDEAAQKSLQVVHKLVNSNLLDVKRRLSEALTLRANEHPDNLDLQEDARLARLDYESHLKSQA